jgi:hypothetical protein
VPSAERSAEPVFVNVRSPGIDSARGTRFLDALKGLQIRARNFAGLGGGGVAGHRISVINLFIHL